MPILSDIYAIQRRRVTTDDKPVSHCVLLFRLQQLQSGTRCQTNLEILTASIVLNGF